MGCSCRMLKKFIVKVFLLSGLFVLLFACGNDSAKPDESKLKSRVESRWALMIDRDFEKTYQYFTPAYRKLYDFDGYLDELQTSGSVEWVSARYLTSVVSNEGADVEVEIDYKLALPDASMNDAVGQISTQMNENWVWSSGQWWYIKKKTGL